MTNKIKRLFRKIIGTCPECGGCMDYHWWTSSKTIMKCVDCGKLENEK